MDDITSDFKFNEDEYEKDTPIQVNRQRDRHKYFPMNWTLFKSANSSSGVAV